MTKYVYVVYQQDLEPWGDWYNGINKIFSTEALAEAYIKENYGKVFPEDREHWDEGWVVNTRVHKVVLEE